MSTRTLAVVSAGLATPSSTRCMTDETGPSWVVMILGWS